MSPGATTFESKLLQAGERQSLTVNLKPGAHLAICAVYGGRHFASGMHTAFTVGTQDDTGAWK